MRIAQCVEKRLIQHEWPVARSDFVSRLQQITPFVALPVKADSPKGRVTVVVLCFHHPHPPREPEDFNQDTSLC